MACHLCHILNSHIYFGLLWTSSSVPLDYWSSPTFVPYCFNYCNFIMYFHNGEVYSILTVLPLKKYFLAIFTWTVFFQMTMESFCQISVLPTKWTRKKPFLWFWWGSIWSRSERIDIFTPLTLPVQEHIFCPSPPFFKAKENIYWVSWMRAMKGEEDFRPGWIQRSLVGH